jgi:hypothetical protein
MPKVSGRVGYYGYKDIHGDRLYSIGLEGNREDYYRLNKWTSAWPCSENDIDRGMYVEFEFSPVTSKSGRTNLIVDMKTFKLVKDGPAPDSVSGSVDVTPAALRNIIAGSQNRAIDTVRLALEQDLVSVTKKSGMDGLMALVDETAKSYVASQLSDLTPWIPTEEDDVKTEGEEYDPWD